MRLPAELIRVLSAPDAKDCLLIAHVTVLGRCKTIKTIRRKYEYEC